MVTTLDQIGNFLSKRGLHFKHEEAQSRILARVEGDNVESLLIVIQLEEEGRFFKVFAPEVLKGVQNHPYKEAILQTMLSISWETKMLQWEYDPSDGEIRAIIEFPLEDAILTERQFFRCLSGLVEMVDGFALPRLLEVMQTGRDPGDLEMGERLLLTIQEEAPGLLELLEKAMAARKRRGRLPPKLDFDGY